jgi:hypothetical protein
MALRRRIKRLRSGRYRFQLHDGERAVLASLLPQVRALLTEAPVEDPRIRRLFPTAYPDDPDKDAEYVRFMRDELVASRLSSLVAVEASLSAEELDEGQLMGWMRAVNDVRLILGTMLDVQEDDPAPGFDGDDPDDGGLLLYHGLGGLLEEIVEALGSGLG